MYHSEKPKSQKDGNWYQTFSINNKKGKTNLEKNNSHDFLFNM